MRVFFDLDGPILDVSEKYYCAYVKSLEALNIRNKLTKEDYWLHKRKKKEDALLFNPTLSTQDLKKYWNFRKGIIETADYLAKDNIWSELKDTYQEMSRKHTLILVTLRTHRSP